MTQIIKEHEDLEASLREQLSSSLASLADLLNLVRAPGAPTVVLPAEMADRTLAELLSNPAPAVELLTMTKQALRVRVYASADGAPQPAASVLYYATIAAALAHCGRRITTRDDRSLRQNFVAIGRLSWVSDEIRALVNEGAKSLPEPRAAASEQPRPTLQFAGAPAASVGLGAAGIQIRSEIDSSPPTLRSAVIEPQQPVRARMRPPARLRLPRLDRRGVGILCVVVALAAANLALWRSWGGDDRGEVAQARPQVSKIATPAVSAVASAVPPATPSARMTAVKMPPILSSAYEGFNDRSDETWILGWAWEKAKPNTPIKVEIDDGVNPTVSVVADVKWEGLVEAGKGNGKHGFMYRTPANLRDGQPHIARVRIAGTDLQLIGSGRTILRARW